MRKHSGSMLTITVCFSGVYVSNEQWVYCFVVVLSTNGMNSFPFSVEGGLMGPVRMISSGHELTTDYDEKALHELGFKDMQVHT